MGYCAVGYCAVEYCVGGYCVVGYCVGGYCIVGYCVMGIGDICFDTIVRSNEKQRYNNIAKRFFEVNGEGKRGKGGGLGLLEEERNEQTG